MEEDNFPFEKDVLYLRGTPPFEYLFFHVDDDKGANFLAFFDSLNSTTPTVFELKEIKIPSLDVTVNGLPEECSSKVLKGVCWKKAHMVNTVFPGSWNQVLRVIRETIISRNSNTK